MVCMLPKQGGSLASAMSHPNASYARLAWCYDELAAAWSLGAIPRAKTASVADVAVGESIVFAGVGRGAEALRAARAGAQVTGVDVAAPMLARLAREAEKQGVEVRCCEASVFEFAPTDPFDRVVANFVLNVFAGNGLGHAIDAMTSWVAPGGEVTVADFAPITGSAARRMLAHAHYWPVALAARALGLCRLHAPHDYRPMFEVRGFALVSSRDIGLYRVEHFERR